MEIFNVKWAFITLLIVFIGYACFLVVSSPQIERSDKTQSESVVDSVEESLRASFTDEELTVEALPDGDLLELVGRASTLAIKERALDLAAQNSNALIEDSIEVTPPSIAEKSNVGGGSQQFADMINRIKVRLYLASEVGLSTLFLRINCVGGVVRLEGEVDSEEAKLALVNAVDKIESVKAIELDLAVED